LIGDFDALYGVFSKPIPPQEPDYGQQAGALRESIKSTEIMLTAVAGHETSLFVEPVDTGGAEKAEEGRKTF
jgi:hypothetical protein